MTDTISPTAFQLRGTAGDGFVQLVWDRPRDNVGVTHVEVWMNNQWQAKLQPYTTSWKKIGLQNFVSYSFKVVAYDRAGNYKNSNFITLTPIGVEVVEPPSPTFNFNTLVFEDNFEIIDQTKWRLYDGSGHAGNGLRDPKKWDIYSDVPGATGKCLVGSAVWDSTINKVRAAGMNHRQGYLYGRFEARLRTDPDPSGVTATNFLTWPDDEVWPAHGENNIWETTGQGNATRTPMKTYIHWDASNQQKMFTHNVSGVDWHTAMMEWTPDYIKIWRDGLLVWTLTEKIVIPDWSHHVCFQIDALVNANPGGSRQFFVDWIKIYK
jgi:hypothetical protein